MTGAEGAAEQGKLPCLGPSNVFFFPALQIPRGTCHCVFCSLSFGMANVMLWFRRMSRAGVMMCCDGGNGTAWLHQALSAVPCDAGRVTARSITMMTIRRVLSRGGGSCRPGSGRPLQPRPRQAPGRRPVAVAACASCKLIVFRPLREGRSEPCRTALQQLPNRTCHVEEPLRSRLLDHGVPLLRRIQAVG